MSWTRIKHFGMRFAWCVTNTVCAQVWEMLAPTTRWTAANQARRACSGPSGRYQGRDFVCREAFAMNQFEVDNFPVLRLSKLKIQDISHIFSFSHWTNTLGGLSFCVTRRSLRISTRQVKLQLKLRVASLENLDLQKDPRRKNRKNQWIDMDEWWNMKPWDWDLRKNSDMVRWILFF